MTSDDDEEAMDVWNLNREMIAVLVQNTIETYPPEWRLIQEPLQNAIDSFIDAAGNVKQADDFQAKVELDLFLGTNRVKITDNGWGVPIDQCRHFLLLGNGTKGSIQDAELKKLFKGSQGVGIKATVFTSRLFRLRTVHEGQAWNLGLDGFADYREHDFEHRVPRPTSNATPDQSGTTVEIQLADYSAWDFIRDRVDEFFDTVGIDNETLDDNGRIVISERQKLDPLDIRKILLRYFKRDSYAGCVLRALGDDRLPPVSFNVRIHCDFPADRSEEFSIPGTKALEAGKTYEETDEIGYLDFPEIIRQLPQRLRVPISSNYRELLEAGNRFTHATAFYQALTRDDLQQLLGDLRKRRQDEDGNTPNVLAPNQDRVNDHATALSRINGAILFIASRAYLKHPLAHKASASISVNGLPTDITMEITGAELGYLPATHLVIDVDQTLGYGKRNLPPRSKGLYNKLGKDLWRTLHKLAGLIVKEEDEFEFSTSGKRFDRGKELQRVLDLGNARNRRFYDLCGRVTPPETEEDLVATYFHLVGAGHLERYNWVRLHDQTIYDALAFSPGTIPRVDTVDLKTIEFKPNVKGLCKADEMRRQRFQDIDLAIVWHIDDNDDLPPGYTVKNRELDVNYDAYLPDANCRVSGGRYSVQVIGLERIVENALANHAAEGED